MKKRIIALIIVFILVAIAIWTYRTWTSPYHIPDVSDELSWEELELDFSKEESSYEKLKNGIQHVPDLPVRNLEEADAAYIYALSTPNDPSTLQDEKITYLQAATSFDPSNMAYGTALRLMMVQNNQIQEFITFVDRLGKEEIAAIQLQKSMAFIDQLQDPSIGTALLGQRSYLSIEILDTILEQNNYNWMAHYARGINNLYWPVGLRRIDLSIQDLSFCVAVARKYEDHGNAELWIRAYTALGDALVKKGSWKDGLKVWEEGGSKYPQSKELQIRQGLGKSEAELIVAKERGMEQFQRPAPEMTDLNVIWNK